jgi:hypothetical protein
MDFRIIYPVVLYDLYPPVKQGPDAEFFQHQNAGITSRFTVKSLTTGS